MNVFLKVVNRSGSLAFLEELSKSLSKLRDSHISFKDAVDEIELLVTSKVNESVASNLKNQTKLPTDFVSREQRLGGA